METITIKELSAYLPFELMAQDCATKEVRTVVLNHFTYNLETVGHNHLLYAETLHKPHKPILYPLDYLTIPITHNGETFVPIERLNELFGYEEVKLTHYTNGGIGWTISSSFGATAITFEDMYLPIQQLLEWRFDCFNLITRNLAVPITETFNPYK